MFSASGDSVYVPDEVDNTVNSSIRIAEPIVLSESSITGAFYILMNFSAHFLFYQRSNKWILEIR